MCDVATAIGLIITVVLFLISTIMTFSMSWKASQELKVEAGTLRKLNKIMLLAMKEQGWVSLVTDKHGNITGMNYSLKAETGYYKTEGGESTGRKTTE